MSEVYYQDATVTVYAGNCLDVLAELPDASVDSVCCDPPYGLANTDPAHVIETLTRWVNGERDYLPGGAGFMGKAWDAFVPPVAVWDDCLRVLKPGGHVLAFAGSRTVDLMTLGLRLAGFDIRDSVAWLYGSGFPKSLDVSKAIDKARDDKAAVLAVTTRLADLAEAAGITRADLDAYMGTSDMGGWWLSRLPHRCACPSVENWARLRDFIPGAHDLDAEVWRLNGRKGSPGEAWDRREVLGERKQRSNVANVGRHVGLHHSRHEVETITAPATPDAERWQGWGTALKPAFEPIVVARKPLAGTVAANVLAHGTGALNIDGCRTAASDADKAAINAKHAGMDLAAYDRKPGDSLNLSTNPMPLSGAKAHDLGRWPANVILDESQAAELDAQSGASQSRVGKPRGADSGDGWGMTATGAEYDDEGGASRFFYVAKADSAERVRVDGIAHPTVKPLDLMRWLVRLITPPGGTVLEPFAGSGTTVEACILEGFRCVAVEREADYLPLIKQRINRRRDPVAAVKATGDDGGLFDLLGEASA